MEMGKLPKSGKNSHFENRTLGKWSDIVTKLEKNRVKATSETTTEYSFTDTKAPAAGG